MDNLDTDERWLEREILERIKSYHSSQRQLCWIFIPHNNTIRHRDLMKRRPTWTVRSPSERKAMITKSISYMLELGRLSTPGTEKFSEFSILIDVPVLEALSRIPDD